MKPIVERSVMEAFQWFRTSEYKDPRNDNLAGVILSRFIDVTDSYSWHIMTSDTQPEHTRNSELVTGHESRLSAPEGTFSKPTTTIRLGFYMHFRIKFPLKNKKDGEKEIVR